MKEADYPLQLSSEDKIRIHFKQNKGKVSHFIVQYYALINGRWRTIMRIDTCHGFAHKHVYYADGKQRVIRIPGELNLVFTESIKYIKKDFLKIKENYKRMLQ